MPGRPVVIIGEVYDPSLGIGGGPMPPGPGQPPGVWPPVGVVTPPIYYPPEIWPPRPPSAGQPPGIWGGGNVPMPTPPIYLPPATIPGVPAHPIYIPPSIWPSPGVPTHPIVIPPEPEKPQVLENWDVKTAWSPQTGWIVAIVPSESHPGVPTPSKPPGAKA